MKYMSKKAMIEEMVNGGYYDEAYIRYTKNRMKDAIQKEYEAFLNWDGKSYYVITCIKSKGDFEYLHGHQCWAMNEAEAVEQAKAENPGYDSYVCEYRYEARERTIR